MKQFKEGDWVYSFMGESLLHVKVNSQDEIRIHVEDGINTYCFYAQDCYSTKEEAIEGMLNAVSEITDCDCGEDATIIEQIKQAQLQVSHPDYWIKIKNAIDMCHETELMHEEAIL